MPTRKITELEKFLVWAREASDDDLQQAIDIINVERRIRAGKKPAQQTARKPRRAETVSTVSRVGTPPGPPNPHKPANDNPQG